MSMAFFVAHQCYVHIAIRSQQGKNTDTRRSAYISRKRM